MVTPPIEENIVRVSISNELVESVLEDEELQGLLPIPNDDMDYSDYVEAVTEGGDINGPFTNVQLDFTQLIPETPYIDLYTRYSYLSRSRDDLRTSETAISLADTIFTQANQAGQLEVPTNTACLRISIDTNGYFEIRYLLNQSSSSVTISVTTTTRYALLSIPVTKTPMVFHFCSTTSNDDIGDIIVMEGTNNDNVGSMCYIRNTIYRLYVRTE